MFGNTTRYGYDGLGLLTSATQVDRESVLVASVGYGYDVFGCTTRVSRGYGVVTEYSFTSASEIASETTTDAQGVVLFEGAYVYDAHGNVEQKTVTQRHVDALESVVETTRCGYNAYNQLVSSRVFEGALANGLETEPVSGTDYEVGVTGNVTRETVTAGGEVTVRELEYNALGQTVAITTGGVRVEQTYDAAGNLVTGADGVAYTYNAHNQPVSVTYPGGSDVWTSYWVTGKRAQVIESDTAEMSYWNGDTLVNQVGGAAVSSYLFGATRVAVTTGSVASGSVDTTTGSVASGGDADHGDVISERGHVIRERRDELGNVVGGDVTNYFVSDRHGSVVALTDAASVPTSSYSYSDYGVPVVHGVDGRGSRGLQGRFLYAGEYTNPDGSQQLGMRTYSPDAFGFTTRDTAPLYNVYAYGNANPVTQIDPSGNTSMEDVVQSGVLAGVGFLVAVMGLVSPVLAGVPSVLALDATIASAALFSAGVAFAEWHNTYHEYKTGDAGFGSWSSKFLDYLGPLALATGVIAGGAGLARTGLVKRGEMLLEGFRDEIAVMDRRRLALGPQNSRQMLASPMTPELMGLLGNARGRGSLAQTVRVSNVNGKQVKKHLPQDVVFEIARHLAPVKLSPAMEKSYQTAQDGASFWAKNLPVFSQKSGVVAAGVVAPILVGAGSPLPGAWAEGDLNRMGPPMVSAFAGATLSSFAANQAGATSGWFLNYMVLGAAVAFVSSMAVAYYTVPEPDSTGRDERF